MDGSLPLFIQFTSTVIGIASTPYTALPLIFTNIVEDKSKNYFEYLARSTGV